MIRALLKNRSIRFFCTRHGIQIKAVESCLQSPDCAQLVESQVLPKIARGTASLVNELEFRQIESPFGQSAYRIQGRFRRPDGPVTDFRCIVKIFTDLDHPELLLCEGTHSTLSVLNRHVPIAPITYAIADPPGEAAGKRWLFREWVVQGYPDRTYPAEVYVSAASKLGVMSGLSMEGKVPLPANFNGGFKFADEVMTNLGHCDLSLEPPGPEGRLAFPAHLQKTLKTFLDENLTEALDVISLMPQTFSHGEATPRHFFAQSQTKNNSIVELKLVDWDLAGVRPLAYDLVKLLGPPVTFRLEKDEDVIRDYVQSLFSSFLDGLVAAREGAEDIPPELMLLSFVLQYILNLPSQLILCQHGDAAMAEMRADLGSVHETSKESRLELATNIGIFHKLMFESLSELWPLRKHAYFDQARASRGAVVQRPSHLEQLDPSIFALWNIVKAMEKPAFTDLDAERERIRMIPKFLPHLGPQAAHHVIEIEQPRAALYVPHVAAELQKVQSLEAALEQDKANFGAESSLLVWCPPDLLVNDCYGLQDPICRLLAKALNVRVLAPALPTCPEARANQLHSACAEMIRTVPNPLILGGGGFGAHVAVGAACELIKSGRPVKGLLLGTPAVALERLLQSESLPLYGDFFMQSRARLEWLWSLYTDGKPLDMVTMLEELAASHHEMCASLPILLFTAEFDALRDEGRALGEALKRTWPGPVSWTHEPTFAHSYLAHPSLKITERCVEEAATTMRKLGVI